MFTQSVSLKLINTRVYFIKYLNIILKANLYQLYRDSTIEIKMIENVFIVSFIIFIEHSVYRTGQPTLSAQGNLL